MEQKPQPPIPNDDQSLIQFVDWLLQPMSYRIFAYKPTESIPKDTNEFIRRLVRPLPYRVFCDKLLEFNAKEFEGLVADLLGSLGGQVIPSKEGADGGADLLWKISKGEYIVQCKKWEKKVGIPIVREIYGATMKSQTNGAFIVTKSEFTDWAIDFTKDLSPRVGLIDGRLLFNLLTQIMPSIVEDIQEGRWKRNKLR
jgi:HJR/Mrr/RecB family endonuclease